MPTCGQEKIYQRLVKKAVTQIKERWIANDVEAAVKDGGRASETYSKCMQEEGLTDRVQF